MENPAAQLPGKNELPEPAREIFVYPPKFERNEQTTNVWLKSITSLALYLALGYLVFKRWEALLLITAIVMIHELGHFFAMKYFKYNDLGIFFIPLLGAYVSGRKREVSQKQSAVILLAGPLPGIIIGSILHLLWLNDPSLSFAGISFSRIALLFIILNLINLFPVYPLDGGQLLNRVFLDEESWLSKLFILLSAGFMCWFAWSLYSSSGQALYLTLFLFPLMMLLRLQSDSKFKAVERRIEEENINADLSYEDLPDEDYWKIRNILIKEHPAFRDIEPAPPYEYSPREEKVMTTIQSLLHRHLLQDMSIVGKIFVFLVWLAAIASPWLLKVDVSFLRHFGF
ncbi:MAG: site-2 protease family protein [Chitinophagaceae bacterium]